MKKTKTKFYMTHGALLTLSASLLWLLNLMSKLNHLKCRGKDALNISFIDKNPDRVHYAPLTV